jgi:putative PIN family toxin of toxin-antitoxin system
MRLVLDTNVLVAAIRSPTGASAAIVRLARRKKVMLCASVALFAEYEAVLKRPEHLAAAGLGLADMDVVLDALASFVERVETYFLWRPRLRDADDDMVLETAINGRAEAIVTFNLRDFGAAAADFGIKVMLPGDALRRLP